MYFIYFDELISGFEWREQRSQTTQREKNISINESSTEIYDYYLWLGANRKKNKMKYIWEARRKS